MKSMPLEDLRNALEQNDQSEVVHLSQDVLESFASVGRLVEKYRELANLVRYGSPPESDAEAAGTDYNETAIELAQHRSGVDQALVEYLGSELSSDEVISRIDGLQTVLSAEREARQTLTDQKTGLDVPPFVYLDLGDVVVRPKGTTVDTTVEIVNLGGEATAEIDLQVSSDLGLSLSTETIPTLQPDESASFDVEGKLPDAGSFQIELAARGEGAAARESMRLVVRDKEDYIEEAVTMLRRDETILGGSVDDGDGREGESGGNRSQGQSSDLQKSEAKLTATLRVLEKALTVADDGGDARAVDSHVRTARRKLDEFFTHLDSVNDDSLANEDRTRLLSNAFNADTRLEQALNAEM